MAKVVPKNEEELDNLSREVAKEKAKEWREKAMEELAIAGERLDWNVDPILASFTEVKWDGQVYWFEVRHSAVNVMEFGSDPHPIEPDQAEALHFFTEEGEEVFTMHVDHPGTPALMFMQKGRESTIASPEDIERQLG